MTRVVPKKSLGQHFLADPNLLGVIGRLAELDAQDVLLEIGPGLGTLTTYLADRALLVHAVELDRRLEPALQGAIGERGNVRLHWKDALRLDISALQPAPAKLVANLPYNIATPVVAESVLDAPSIGRWVVMVQLEVAERFFAQPSTKAYGSVSVLLQLATRRTGIHRVSRNVFRPPPRVDSALVAFERIAAPPGLRAVKALVDASFAHRRKTLANSLALGGVADRDRAVEALGSIGREPAVRAEALSPVEFVALEEALRAC